MKIGPDMEYTPCPRKEAVGLQLRVTSIIITIRCTTVTITAHSVGQYHQKLGTNLVGNICDTLENKTGVMKLLVLS